jgi:hypothetical protein
MAFVYLKSVVKEFILNLQSYIIRRQFKQHIEYKRLNTDITHAVVICTMLQTYQTEGTLMSFNNRTSLISVSTIVLLQ